MANKEFKYMSLTLIRHREDRCENCFFSNSTGGCKKFKWQRKDRRVDLNGVKTIRYRMSKYRSEMFPCICNYQNMIFVIKPI